MNNKQLYDNIMKHVAKEVKAYLNESNINLLTDLDDNELDQLDSLQTKNINHKILTYTYFPKTKEELVEIIKSEVEKNGWECSLNHINTRKITNMSYMFSGHPLGYGLGEFNGDISKWNVSTVENMDSMFSYNKSFNQPIGGWDVSKVINMRSMFYYAKSFNQPIGGWDVSKVINMNGMFYNAKSFNQPIGDWDISNIQDISWMFLHAKTFNQDLSKWKIHYDCNTYRMFDECPIKKEYKPKRI